MEKLTLNMVKQCLEAYAHTLQEIDTDDENEGRRLTELTRQDFLRCIQKLCTLNPELFQLNMPDFLDDEDASIVKKQLLTNANRRYSLDYLPTATVLHDIIHEDIIQSPVFVPWQDESNQNQNFVINYTNSEKREALLALNTLMMNMLIGLPTKKVLLNVFDFNMTGMFDFFTINLDPILYHDEIVYNEETASNRLKYLLGHMVSVMKKYGNLVAYNNRMKKITMPYEVVILNCYPYCYDNYLSQLMPLFENGPKCGIYFIVLNNTDYTLRDKEERHLLDIHNYQVLTLPKEPVRPKDHFVSYTPFSASPLLANICFEYLHEECTKLPKTSILKPDFESATKSAYEPVMSEISVTIGMDIEKKDLVTLRFNSKDYIHAFILGQSGSGKSVLLNNIITTAINKYAPEDLMLYLMDFKGVEFNRFRGLKHTKAVLVDNSDPQMTLEILRELKEENRKRIKLWQSEGVNNIDGYNHKHPDARMPQVLFVADECQVMFCRPSGTTSFVMQREINEIINIIATQGRSQGIHMLLATQTLDDTDISGAVLKNLTECFLLMCAPSDSNILVPDSSDLTAKQPIGQYCYYHKKELKGHVQSFYANDEELEIAINASQKKSEKCSSNGGSYFSGSSMFEFNDIERERILSTKYSCPTAIVGHNIGLKGELTSIPLRRDFSENILFWGINREEQTVGVTISALMSLIMSYKQMGKSCCFKVIDCLNAQEAHYRGILDAMQDIGLCELVERQQSGILLQRLVNDICGQCASPTILAIIGSERFSEMKRKTPLPMSEKTSFGNDDDVISMDMSAMPNLFDNGANNLDASKIKTYPDALKFILDEGPMQGIHVLLQVDKPENILFDGEYCTDATDKFHHRVILRSENKFLVPFRFSEDIDVESLGVDEERLRAYYYPEGGKPQLFTPYLMPKSKKIINTLTITTIIKWEQQIVQ